jgi:hypothetical protein
MAKWMMRGLVFTFVVIVAIVVFIGIHGPFAIVHTGADRLNVTTDR